MADAVDLLVAVALTAGLYFAVAGVQFLVRPRGFSWPVLGALPLGALSWGLLIVYLTIGWSSSGRSAGKQLIGLRVERADDGRLGLGRAFVRAVLCALFPIGLFWSLISSRNASVQDLLVGTKVVYDWRPRLPLA